MAIRHPSLAILLQDHSLVNYFLDTDSRLYIHQTTISLGVYCQPQPHDLIVHLAREECREYRCDFPTKQLGVVCRSASHCASPVSGLE